MAKRMNAVTRFVIETLEQDEVARERIGREFADAIVQTLDGGYDLYNSDAFPVVSSWISETFGTPAGATLEQSQMYRMAARQIDLAAVVQYARSAGWHLPHFVARMARGELAAA